jgi:hypothetical protein
MAQQKAAKSSGRRKSSSQAGKYVRDEMHKEKQGKRKNPKQAVAIGLSKARRAGKNVPQPKAGKTSEATRKRAKRDVKAGQKAHRKRTSSSSGRSTTPARKSGARKKTGHKSTGRKTARRG